MDDKEVICGYLEQVPVLARLTPGERRLITEICKTRKYNVGDYIVKQGEVGDAFFVIKEGEASVLLKDKAYNTETEVAKLKTGDYFGETSLFNNGKRSASIRATVPTTCLSLECDTFQNFFVKKLSKIEFTKRKAVSAEKFDSEKEKLLEKVIPTDVERLVDPATKTFIMEAVRENLLFTKLDEPQLLKIVEEMYLVKVKKGTVLIKQSQYGDNFFVVEEGKFDIYIENKKEAPNLVATRGKGESFGELALMYNSPRAATVIATTEARVWAVTRASFRKVLIKVTKEKLGEFHDFLQNVPILQSLLKTEIHTVAESLDEVTFEAGFDIVKQGDPGDAFFIIRFGEAEVWKSEGEKPPVKVVNLRPGSFFGERALLKDDVRAATVRAKTTLTCLIMDRASFNLTLGPISEILNRKIVDEYDQKLEVLNVREQQREKGLLMDDNNQKYEKIPLSTLTTVGTLGKGSFGHVYLVLDPVSGVTMALKCVSKRKIVELGQEQHIMSEKEVMSRLTHPFIIQLYETYKDKKKLYFLMEVSLGGELFSLMKSRRVLDETTTRFYTACVTLAFSYMHRKKIIYRDLKPENLLMDSEGFLKMTDFGFAKYLPDDRTFTLCGTPDYLSPEVILGLGHGRAVDWWTLGILTFEMLASYPPFYDEDPMKTYAKIMQGTVEYPKNFSPQACDLIRSFLNRKPTKRLGIAKGGVERIIEHNWFHRFQWEGLYDKEIEPPYKPSIRNSQDLSNFEYYSDEENETQTVYEEKNNEFAWSEPF